MEGWAEFVLVADSTGSLAFVSVERMCVEVTSSRLDNFVGESPRRPTQHQPLNLVERRGRISDLLCVIQQDPGI